MSRKLRLEFPGACYHVINRGNYRRDAFATSKTKSAFVSCLFEACLKSAWILHAFVVMRNHFHLAVETPLGNLVAGMHWLECTFANRFNRFRDERGHLFRDVTRPCSSRKAKRSPKSATTFTSIPCALASCPQAG